MNKKSMIFWILVIGMAIRMIRLDQPLFEFATRQVETAMIARNFYYHGFRLFSPEMDIVGEKGRSSIFALELGMVPFLAALLYKISGGVHEYLGRCVSLIFWLGSAIIFYRWLLYFKQRVALYGLLIYTFLPLSIILSRTFQPEMAMLFFSILGLCYLTKYSLGEREISLWLGAVSISIAMLLKVTAFSLMLPFVFLVFKRGRQGNRWIKLLMAGLFIISLPLAWYSRGFLLSQIYPSELSTSNWRLSNWFNFSMYFRPESWRAICNNLWGIVLTPLGFALFLLGLFLKKNKSIESLFYWWLSGIAFSLFFFFFHARTHVYYWLPLIPVASYFIAVCLISLEESRIREKLFGNIIARISMILIVVVTAFYYIYPAYRIPRAYAKAGEVAAAVNSRLSPDSLIIASCSSGPYFLYYCNRRGWDFWVNAPDTNHIEHLESLRGMGAEYFVSSNLEELNTNKILSKYLCDNYEVIWEKESTGIIFSLKK